MAGYCWWHVPWELNRSRRSIQNLANNFVQGSTCCFLHDREFEVISRSVLALGVWPLLPPIDNMVVWGKREDYQNCSALYCVLKLCTVLSTLRWAVLTVLWMEWAGFCPTGPISLWINLFMLICVYFVCFCFMLHSCCIIASVVGWTWWGWSLILRTYLRSVL